jgi:hypothetical protein
VFVVGHSMGGTISPSSRVSARSTRPTTRLRSVCASGWMTSRVRRRHSR